MISIKLGYVLDDLSCEVIEPEIIHGKASTESIAEMGSTAITITNLNPSGKVQINGKKYNAVSDGGFIPSGETVKVSGKKGFSLIVKELKISNQSSDPT